MPITPGRYRAGEPRAPATAPDANSEGKLRGQTPQVVQVPVAVVRFSDGEIPAQEPALHAVLRALPVRALDGDAGAGARRSPAVRGAVREPERDLVSRKSVGLDPAFR